MTLATLYARWRNSVVAIQISPEDVPNCRSYRWHVTDRTKTGKPYVRTRIGGKTQYLSRHITGCPAGFVVDHKNNDTLDNRRSNLRIASYSQNAQNRVAKSGLKGVSREPSGRYRARIEIAGKGVSLGTFDTAEDAARAYDAAAIARFGEFAATNYAAAARAAVVVESDIPF